MRRILACLALACLLTVSLASSAAASEMIGENAQAVSLRIDSHGGAHVSFISYGHRYNVNAWGAINARDPNPSLAQVQFRYSFAAEAGGECLPYDGPPIAWLVKACTAPDGSYWALQSWQRMNADYGGSGAPWELRLSHWRGQLPQLTINLNWAYGHFQHLFGIFTYQGVGVHGFHSTAGGQPLDSYGRNIYLDTRNSAYGSGWRRENSFLTHNPTGTFCYGFYTHGSHPAGTGSDYRATVEGPGVLPDIMWQGQAQPTFDPAVQQQMLSLERSYGDKSCHV